MSAAYQSPFRSAWHVPEPDSLAALALICGVESCTHLHEKVLAGDRRKILAESRAHRHMPQQGHEQVHVFSHFRKGKSGHTKPRPFPRAEFASTHETLAP